MKLGNCTEYREQKLQKQCDQEQWELEQPKFPFPKLLNWNLPGTSIYLALQGQEYNLLMANIICKMSLCLLGLVLLAWQEKWDRAAFAPEALHMSWDAGTGSMSSIFSKL